MRTSSAETLISEAFSSASCLMNFIICTIWSWTCDAADFTSGPMAGVRAHEPAWEAAAAGYG